MPTKKGVATPHHKPEQRIEIANRVCQMKVILFFVVAAAVLGILYALGRAFANWTK